MTVSTQIIEVINDLCAKFGIVIDWSAETVVPILQALAEKYIRWEIATSAMWLALCTMCTVVYMCLIVVGFKKRWNQDFMISFVVFGVFVMFGCICIGCVQVSDIIEAIIIPEKTILELIQKALSSN